jgi:hypothetical protein
MLSGRHQDSHFQSLHNLRSKSVSSNFCYVVILTRLDHELAAIVPHGQSQPLKGEKEENECRKQAGSEHY